MSVYKIAIDLDSSRTNIYMLGYGMVLSEPTVAAVSTDGKYAVKAVGTEASKLIGKTAENTKIVFPVFEGEIVNVKVASQLLSEFLRKIEIKSRLAAVQAVFSVPCGITPEMLSKYEEVAKNAGIGKVYFVESPILCALGQRIPLTESSPNFLVDMAGGTTSIAALTLDGIISGVSVNFGSYKISTDIIDFVAELYGIQIGLQTAERLKKEIGSLSDNDALSTVVNGRDVKTGVPKSVSVKASDIITPIKRYFDSIADIALSVLVKLPPEVSAEIRHVGICLAGDAAGIYGLEKYYSSKFGMPIKVAENSDMVAALGGGVAIGNGSVLEKVCIKRPR